MPNHLHSFFSAWRIARQQRRHRLVQGRLSAKEAATRLPTSGENPLASLPPAHKPTPTIFATAENRGHLLVVAPPGSPWRDQLCLSLSQWPGAALVVDPDRRLYQQTAALRQTEYGSVYAHPGYRLRTNSLLRLWQEESAYQLHQLLMPPQPGTGSATTADIQGEIHRTVSLFCAVGHYSLVHKQNPFQLLLDVALTDMLRALAALETVPQARLHVRHFSKGQPPHLAIYDADTIQAFSWFCHQLWRYQEAYTTFALPTDEAELVPGQWFRKKETLYLTHAPGQMTEGGGLVATILHGQLLAHKTFGGGEPLLLILNAQAAGRLPHFSQFLTTAADYGITVILTAPTVSALTAISPHLAAEQITSQFSHQLWYAPRDRETAVAMAIRIGTQLSPTGAPAPVHSPEELLGWPDKNLLVLTQQERPYLFIGQPVTMPVTFPQRQPPLPPTAEDKPRPYDSWLPPLPRLTDTVKATLIAQGSMRRPGEAVPAARVHQEAEVEATAVPREAERGSRPSSFADKPPAEEEEATEKSLHIIRTKFR